jgi:polyphosphate kinase
VRPACAGIDRSRGFRRVETGDDLARQVERRIGPRHRACVDALYEASSSGVEILLAIRGACTLLPGIDGLSERIQVRSIVGEFLEHSRIWRFENGGRPEFYIGSADLMDRNLDRRVEVFTPVDDPEAQRQLDEVLAIVFADDRRSWMLGGDGRWRRSEELIGIPGSVDSQQLLKRVAAQRAHDGATPHRPHAGGGSLAPWA